MGTAHELTPEQLGYQIQPELLAADMAVPSGPPAGIIGQERAVAALQAGLDIHDNGYNIYVSGPPGIGKMAAVQRFLEERAGAQPVPPDWCYVHGFEDPYKPTVFRLPAGRGRRFQQDMQVVIAQVRSEIPRAFEGEPYATQRDEITRSIDQQREQLIGQLNERALHEGFAIKITPTGIIVLPLASGHPMRDDEFEALSEEQRAALLQRRDSVQAELQVVMKQGHALERAAQEQLRTLDQQIVLSIVGGLFDEIIERYRDLPEIAAYLQGIQHDILEHSELFRSPGAAGGMPESLAAASPWMQEIPFRKYQVNVLVDNSRQSGAPVVVELNASYINLFGRIEKESLFGSLTTDFTQIKPGSIHQANGGYLVLPADDMLRNPVSWDALKRAMRSKSIEIEDLGERLGLISTKSLRPQSIPLDMKVILVGSPLIYTLLATYDETFLELFKVRADFDIRVDRTPENQQALIGFMIGFCRQEGLQPLDAGAVAQLLAYTSRLAEDQDKLSSRQGMLIDTIREAHVHAAHDHAEAIGAEHVRQALDARIFRSNMLQQHYQEAIADGTLLIDTDGSQVGLVNGLSVVRVSEYDFGRPSRISASVGPGRGEIVDIEREVALGGPLHSKGVLIVSGYLTHMYARDKPLSLNARLVFEQSYAGVEGDSASSAELYAVLSALADVPIAQGIAVTGSVDQHGHIQAIGGVNEKIEGFFDVCNARGLTGAQGVLIPHSNRRHLMLRDDVVAAVRTGQFHIWAITAIDEGLELLTGIPAGTRAPEGSFPAGSVHARVDQRLRSFTTSLRELGAPQNVLLHNGAGRS